MCTCVERAWYIYSYNRKCIQLRHSDLLQQVQDDYVIKISEICTEQLKIIGTKNCLCLQSKLEICEVHYLVFQKIGLIIYISFHVNLLVAHKGK